MFKIGSHDTMTYLPPKYWWMRPFKFIARCQRKTIEEQYEQYGIRLFDIRIRYNEKTKEWIFAHGLMPFKGKTPKEVLDYLNSQSEQVLVRLILEYSKEPKNVELISSLFSMQAAKWREEYSNLVFFGFNRKYDWKRLYTYDGMREPSMYQAISSQTCKTWDDWWPWLYAFFNNADNLKQGTNCEYMLLDFVDLQK